MRFYNQMKEGPGPKLINRPITNSNPAQWDRDTVIETHRYFNYYYNEYQEIIDNYIKNYSKRYLFFKSSIHTDTNAILGLAQGLGVSPPTIIHIANCMSPDLRRQLAFQIASTTNIASNTEVVSMLQETSSTLRNITEIPVISLSKRVIFF